LIKTRKKEKLVDKKPVTDEKIIKIYKEEFKQLMIVIPSYDSNNQTPPNTDCQSQSRENAKSQ
jgi:hypothetical protein